MVEENGHKDNSGWPDPTSPIARTIASKGAEVTRNYKPSKERNREKQRTNVKDCIQPWVKGLKNPFRQFLHRM